jgi:hypothetical protein
MSSLFVPHGSNEDKIEESGDCVNRLLNEDVELAGTATASALPPLSGSSKASNTDSTKAIHEATALGSAHPTLLETFLSKWKKFVTKLDQRRRKTYVFNCWLWEFLGVTLSVASFASIVVVLNEFDQKTKPNLRYGITVRMDFFPFSLRPSRPASV